MKGDVLPYLDSGHSLRYAQSSPYFGSTRMEKYKWTLDGLGNEVAKSIY